MEVTAASARAALLGVTVLVDDTTDDVREELNVHALVRSAELPREQPTA